MTTRRIDKKQILALLRERLPRLDWQVSRDDSSVVGFAGRIGPLSGDVVLTVASDPFFYAYPAMLFALGKTARLPMQAVPLTPQESVDWAATVLNELLANHRAVASELESAIYGVKR